MPTQAEFFKDDKGRDKIYVKIVGENTDITRDVKPEDIKKFPEQWRRYQTGGTTVEMKGTPLSKLESIVQGMADFLARNGIFTVEQLANLPDITCQQFGMGWLTIRNEAKSYIAENGSSSEPLPVAPPAIAPTEADKQKRHREVLSKSMSLKKVSEAEKEDA